MKKKNPYVGSSFESWLDEVGIREEVTIAAIEAVTKLAAKTKRPKG
jgi:antitoxin HicB